jgi:hypothetical protein
VERDWLARGRVAQALKERGERLIGRLCGLAREHHVRLSVKYYNLRVRACVSIQSAGLLRSCEREHARAAGAQRGRVHNRSGAKIENSNGFSRA